MSDDDLVAAISAPEQQRDGTWRVVIVPPGTPSFIRLAEQGARMFGLGQLVVVEPSKGSA